MAAPLGGEVMLVKSAPLVIQSLSTQSSDFSLSPSQAVHKLYKLQPDHSLVTFHGDCSTSHSPLPTRSKGVAILFTPRCHFQTFTLPLPVKASATLRLGQVVISDSNVSHGDQLPTSSLKTDSLPLPFTPAILLRNLDAHNLSNIGVS